MFLCYKALRSPKNHSLGVLVTKPGFCAAISYTDRSFSGWQPSSSSRLFRLFAFWEPLAEPWIRINDPIDVLSVAKEQRAFLCDKSFSGPRVPEGCTS